MDKRFLVDRQGKTFCLYAGLLDEAHRLGLLRIDTQIIQIPDPDNEQTAICRAEVQLGHEGVVSSFSGIGDANPSNVSRMMIPHILRMAETRAKARALRDAVNIGITALEELGGPDLEEKPPTRPTPVQPNGNPAAWRPRTA